MVDKNAILNFKAYLNSVVQMNEQDFALATPFLKVTHIPKGEYFIRHGEYCNKVAFIDSGLFKIYNLKDGVEVNTCFCTEGTITSSLASFSSGNPSQEVIQAIEDSTIVVLQKQHLLRFYEQNPTWQAVGRLLTEKECMRLSERATSLSFETALEKYRGLLNTQPDIINRVPVQDIASHIGVTRETLSRIRAKVARD